MKKAKKIVAVALAAASMSLAFAGCGGSAESSSFIRNSHRRYGSWSCRYCYSTC